MFDSLTAALVSLVLEVINIFPESPIQPLIQSLKASGIEDWLAYANYIVPVAPMLGILTTWLTCIAAYYVYQIILRWMRAIE